jgi:hypothetical protein
MLREDTGKRCTNLVSDGHLACDDCCDLLEILIEQTYLEQLYDGTLPGLEVPHA